MASLSEVSTILLNAFKTCKLDANTLLNPIQWFVLYKETHALVSIVTLVIIISFLCFVFALPSRNYSQVDRLWSVLPFAYVYHFLIISYLNHEKVDARLLLMAALTTAWGMRLTYNFARKGGYSLSHQDYRWPELMKIIRNRFLFELFNFFFIAFYQNILIFLFSGGVAYVAYTQRGTPLNNWDYAATALFCLFLLGETIADQQQWVFQNKKYEMIAAKEELPAEYKAGFITSGLFYYSRHPNFFCEMSIWWSFYLFTVASFNGTILLHWSVIGTILLTMLFQGSTAFTEWISCNKYPLYKQYQRTTPMLFPWIPSK